MLDVAKFKQHLMDSGLVEKAHLERAQKHAFEKGLSLSEALLALNIIGVRKLGECLSQVYELPYAAIQQRAVSAEARRMLSAECVCRWKVFPVAYDPEAKIFTLAIFDPDHAQKLERIFRFLMSPVTPGFVMVSRPEMQTALTTHYRVAPASKPHSPKATTANEKKTLKLSGLHAADRKKASKEGPANAEKPVDSAKRLRSLNTEADGVRSGPPKQIGSSSGPDAAMRKSLLNSVALLVESRLRHDPGNVMIAKARARYCTLLAVRTNRTPETCDAVTIAAWLSVLEDALEVARQLGVPYDLEKILSSRKATKGEAVPEAVILNMVQQYQAFRIRNPEAAHDLHKVREALRATHSGGAETESSLEVFLQILMDEEFVLSQEKTIGGADEKSAEAEASGQGVKGSLADMSFTDMVQILCAGGKSLEITLKSADGEGCVHISKGDVVHAEVKDLSGDQAFYRMMQWHEGSFSTRSRSDFPVRTIHASLMALLMEGARLSDES